MNALSHKLGVRNEKVDAVGSLPIPRPQVVEREWQNFPNESWHPNFIWVGVCVAPQVTRGRVAVTNVQRPRRYDYTFCKCRRIRDDHIVPVEVEALDCGGHSQQVPLVTLLPAGQPFDN